MVIRLGEFSFNRLNEDDDPVFIHHRLSPPKTWSNHADAVCYFYDHIERRVGIPLDSVTIAEFEFKDGVGGGPVLADKPVSEIKMPPKHRVPRNHVAVPPVTKGV